MDSASFQFVLFGLATAAVSNLSRSKAWRSLVLLGASIIFLGLLEHNVIAFLPLASFLFLGYAGLLLLELGWSKSLPWCLLAIVFAYTWLKKYSFLPHDIFISSPYFTLGISYIFFRVLHLLIESGDSNGKRNIGIRAYLLYALNFTTLISGPIQRYEEFARDQFANEPIILSPSVVLLQLERIIRGFFKVNVLATFFNMIWADALLQMSQPLPQSAKLSAAFRLTTVYPLFLYSNFSGYIDIIIAFARLMRVRLPENFGRPFAASSVLDFWNQWHITLSNWLKTYVYNPLLVALIRRIPSPQLTPLFGVLSYFVTFFLIGVWHGRSSEFIVFGVLTGGGMSINKLWQLAMVRIMSQKSYKVLARNPFYDAFGRGLNYVWFGLTLFWFWGSWQQIDELFSALSFVRWLEVWLAAWLFATGIGAIWESSRATLLSIKIAERQLLTCRYARVVYASVLGLTAFLTTVLLNQPAPSIVYKAF
jgi:alginate O-acetyltransferase complex protein AlgI